MSKKEIEEKINEEEKITEELDELEVSEWDEKQEMEIWGIKEDPYVDEDIEEIVEILYNKEEEEEEED